MKALYEAIEIKDGNSTEPVQYVGVYALNWKPEWGEPEMGFVEYAQQSQPSVPTVEQLKDAVVYIEQNSEATIRLTAEAIHDLCTQGKEKAPVIEDWEWNKFYPPDEPDKAEEVTEEEIEERDDDERSMGIDPYDY